MDKLIRLNKHLYKYKITALVDTTSVTDGYVYSNIILDNYFDIIIRNKGYKRFNLK